MRAQQRACRIWDVRRVPASFLTPVRSTAPVLMISGQDDPATPPAFGRAALKYLPNGRQIVVPHAGHSIESECIDRLIVAFVDTRDSKHLKPAVCVDSSKRPAFALSMKGFR